LLLIFSTIGKGRHVTTISSFRSGKETASSFHLSHVRSLIRDRGESGGATNQVPKEVLSIHENRVAGEVAVLLPCGAVSYAVAFEAPARDDVPSRHFAHGVLNGVTYWFRCADTRAGQADASCFRAYFAHEGKWFFFHTQGAALPFGAEVNFSVSETWATQSASQAQGGLKLLPTGTY
jgi:hypothetical protein